MATCQIINLQTGEFRTVSLEEASAIAELDPHEIEWAIAGMAFARPTRIRSRSCPSRPKGVALQPATMRKVASMSGPKEMARVTAVTAKIKR
jgi:hypothetical protein